VRLAAHLGTIGESKRKRDEVERRFQNPGQNHPVTALEDEFPVLLGLNEINGQRVLVGMDAHRRIGKNTRQSFFMPFELLVLGATRGWAEHLSDTGERIVAFAPQLLPLYIEAHREQRPVDGSRIQEALSQADVQLSPQNALAAGLGLARLALSAEERIEDARSKKRKHLDLSRLGLTALPPALAECIYLQSLNLSNNSLTELPEFLGQFVRLRSLIVSDNDLTALPDFLARLIRLQILNVASNHLGRLPDFLGQLTELRFLDISDTQIDTLPESLGNLTALHSLVAYQNKLQHLPSWLLRLSSLEELSVSWNQLSELPDWIGRLQSLVGLYLANNRLTSLPDSLCTLERLESLVLGCNPLTTLPSELGNLSRLQFLDLNTRYSILIRDRNTYVVSTSGSSGPGLLQALPDSIHKLSALKELLLHGQTALGLPPELLGPSPEDLGPSGSDDPNTAAGILNYYFSKRRGRPLNEAKLILVGRGGVGKTSLVNRLVHGTYNPLESKTDGIAITAWPLHIGAESIRLNVWDFGGQEIMHATHQFFLTKRSLYVLVLDAREGEQEANVEYWLSLIESFGGNSPVLVVINKIKEHSHDLNRQGLRNKFHSIRGFYPTDCRTGEGLKELSEAIQRETDALEHLRDPFPESWLKVKNTLADLPRTEHKSYITFSRYQEICTENGLTEPTTQETLVGFLHDLGIVVNFRDDPRLAETHVLDPEWVTNGIYKILNAPTLARKHGELQMSELVDILSPRDYPPEIRLYLLDLMRKFELCYAFYDSASHYLVPELLTKEEPLDLSELDAPDALRFEYRYNILPEGLLPRLIVRARALNKSLPRWRTGAVLAWHDNRALVKADIQDKRVSIAVTGPPKERRNLLSVIRNDLEHIHRSIAKLEVTEHVPVPGYPGLAIGYEDLRTLEAANKRERDEVYNRQVVTLVIPDLLDGVEDISVRSRDSILDPTARGAVRVAFSYSHKDEELRDELEIHLKLLQHLGLISTWNDKKITGGEPWRDVIDESFRRADLILLLISGNFFASDYCYRTEMPFSLERHKKGEARVVPIILSACDWDGAPFEHLQALPKNATPVESWPNRNEAWHDVAKGIRKVVEDLRARRV
jgi:internalin A